MTLAMETKEEIAVAMDVGGTWIRAALVGRDGKVLWHRREPSRPPDAAGGVESRVEEVARQALEQAGGRVVGGIGLAVAGPMDPTTGVMYGPPNLPELDGISLRATVERSLGIPVVTGNDANLAALAEYAYGAGGDARILVYMTISTGIGGGIVVDGEMFQGAHGLAAELGHMCVEMDGPECSCGATGHLEAIASGTAIAQAARHQIADGEASLMTDLASGDVDAIGARLVFTAAAQGDSMALDIVDRAGRALGAGMVSILHTFDPDLIVVGGAVSQQWNVLWPIVETYVLSHAMKPYRQRLNVIRSSLGDDIGLLGAAALVWRKL